jgi:hypothetical protein
MRRIRLVVALAAMTATMALFAVPAVADDGRDYDDVLDDRAERVEQRLENHGYDLGDLDGEDLYGYYWNIYDNFGWYHDE